MADQDIYHAAILAALDALDPQAGDADLSYVDLLRRMQGVVTMELSTAGGAIDADKDASVRQAIGLLDPHNDDGQQDYATLLRRLQAAVDRELSKWTSAMVQPPGPSGDTAVAEPQQTEPV